MGMFEEFKKKIGLAKKEENKSRTEEIMSQRDDIKKGLALCPSCQKLMLKNEK